MNNELKQLCEQAKAYATESTKDFTGDEPVVWMDYYTERFTKLIVKECIDQASIGNGHGNNQWDRALTFASNSIKDHFGVEE